MTQLFDITKRRTGRTKKMEHRQDAVGADDTKKTRRTRKMEHRRDTVGVDATKKTRLTKKLEPRRDTAGADDTKKTRRTKQMGRTKQVGPRRDVDSTASYDKKDDDDELEQDAGEEDDDQFEPEAWDDDDYEQDGADDGRRRKKNGVTRRERCKMPSSPRTRERHQRAQRMFRLPRGYHRVSESNLLQLLGGSKTRLSQPRSPQGNIKACSDGKRDAYYDIYVREQIDRASFTLLNFHMDDVEAFTYMDSPPDALHQRLIDLPCMIVCPPNPQPGPKTGVTRFNVHYYCRHHKRAEAFTIYPSYAVAISAFRPSQETWLKLFDTNKQRSHLCHNALCEHPLHSIPETSEQNHSRNLCRFKASGLGERYDGRTAAANTYDHCPHEPPCFSYNARLIADKKEYNAEAF